MKRRTQFLIALLALVAAAGVGWFVYRTFASMVTTAEVVTPAVTVPAGALITPEMLTVKTVPRPLLEEEIYARPEDLAGRVAVVPLYPGMVVYRTFAVPPEAYRLAEDPALEVVSFPVDPAKAVGGQLQPGHRVDIWRLVAVRPTSGLTVTEVVAQTWATATLLVENVPVVDVRSGSGQPYARAPQAIPGEVSPEAQPSGGGVALQILTVAVPRDVAQALLTLVAEERSAAELWVTLAPLTGEQEVRVHRIALPAPASGEETGGIGREEEAQINPSPPTGVRAEVTEEGVLVRWLGTGDDRVVEYVVYREGASWKEVARVPATGDDTGEYEALVEGGPGLFGGLQAGMAAQLLSLIHI